MDDDRDPRHDLDDLHPEAPDTFALRRRVLLTGVLAIGLYVAALVVLDAVRAPDFAAIGAMVAVYVLVVRPLMRPVREAVKLRRRLAYQAWADQRDAADGEARSG